jgi:hypothetical protein
VSFDKVERGQVNASKRFIFDMPFLELPLRKPQMKNLQAILDLKKKRTKRPQPSEHKKKIKSPITHHEENAKSKNITPPTKKKKKVADSQSVNQPSPPGGLEKKPS